MSGRHEKFNPKLRSHFAHAKPLVVQAWDVSLGRWLDTIYGGESLHACEEHALQAARNPERWVGGKVGRTRIVHRRCAK